MAMCVRAWCVYSCRAVVGKLLVKDAIHNRTNRKSLAMPCVCLQGVTKHIENMSKELEEVKVCLISSSVDGESHVAVQLP